MDINQIFSQLQTIASLYAEVLLCILAAGLFGWIVGLMMQRSRHKKKLAKTSKLWRARYESLEATSRTDTENLEEQLQSLAKGNKTLKAKNRALSDSLKKNDSNIQKTRAEAIELNRQHADTHESLQRTLEQKDLEIAELCKRLNIEPRIQNNDQTTPAANAAETLSRLADAIADSDLANADTIAITPAQLPTNKLDALKGKTDKAIRNSTHIKSVKPAPSDLDATLDDTSDLSEVGLEESTVAMDEDALGFARQSLKSQQRD